MSSSGSEYEYEDPLQQLRYIYSKHSSSSCSKEYENSFPAVNEIKGLVQNVSDNVTRDVSFSEKHQAFKVILEIAIEVLEGDGDQLGSDIRKRFWFAKIGRVVTHIVDILLPEELGALQADGGLDGVLREARQEASDYALDMELDDVIRNIDM